MRNGTLGGSKVPATRITDEQKEKRGHEYNLRRAEEKGFKPIGFRPSTGSFWQAKCMKCGKVYALTSRTRIDEHFARHTEEKAQASAELRGSHVQQNDGHGVLAQELAKIRREGPGD